MSTVCAVILLMPRWMILQHGNHLEAQFLVKPWGLKTERSQNDLVTTTGAGFLFRCLEDLCPDILSSEVGMHLAWIFHKLALYRCPEWGQYPAGGQEGIFEGVSLRRRMSGGNVVQPKGKSRTKWTHHRPRDQARCQRLSLYSGDSWSIKYLTTSQQTQDEPRALSGGVPRREGHHIQQGGDTMQERLHWAGARQLEKDTVLVLFDLCGDLEEGHDDRRGLGLRERGRV
jgi:hypothetical protein